MSLKYVVISLLILSGILQATCYISMICYWNKRWKEDFEQKIKDIGGGHK